MKARSHLIAAGLVLPVAALILAYARLQSDASALRTELTRLETKRSEQTARLTANAGRWRAQEEEKKQIEQQIVADEAPLSPGQRRAFNLTRAERMLAATASQSAPAAPAGPGALLTPGKGGKVYFSELLGDLDYATAAQTIERLQIETTYGRFLAGLNLDPAQRAKLEDLLVEREMAKQDILGLGQDSDPAAIAQARATETRRWNASVKEALGPDIVPQLSAYDGTLRLRTAVEDLGARLSYTPEPLQPAQSEQLLQSLVENLGPRVNTMYWAVPDQVIARAQTFLTPAQVVALQHIREEQQGNIQARTARQDAAAAAK